MTPQQTSTTVGVRQEVLPEVMVFALTIQREVLRARVRRVAREGAELRGRDDTFSCDRGVMLGLGVGSLAG